MLNVRKKAVSVFMLFILIFNMQLETVNAFAAVRNDIVIAEDNPASDATVSESTSLFKENGSEAGEHNQNIPPEQCLDPGDLESDYFNSDNKQSGEDMVEDTRVPAIQTESQDSGSDSSVVDAADAFEWDGAYNDAISDSAANETDDYEPDAASYETDGFEPDAASDVTDENIGASSGKTANVKIRLNYDQAGARHMVDVVNDFRTGSEAWAYDKSGNKDYK